MSQVTRDLAIGADPDSACPFLVPVAIQENLEVLCLEYWSPHRTVQVGQLVVHRAIAGRVKQGFVRLLKARFLIAQMMPIVAYGWNDDRSMAANNTSGFNYRYIAGTNKLSLHAHGLAFDINPLWNPCRSNGVWTPDVLYIPGAPGTISQGSWVATMWRDLGFTCGVNWQEPFDPQHIQMSLDAI